MISLIFYEILINNVNTHGTLRVQRHKNTLDVFQGIFSFKKLFKASLKL